MMCQETSVEVGVKYRVCRGTGSNMTTLLKEANSPQIQIRLETS
jgi:hypothetical protein